MGNISKGRVRMNLGLSGKRALVTGSTAGIGLAIATALAREGAMQASVAGSGSTVFGVFAGEAQRRQAAEALGRMFETWKLLETRAIRGAAHVERGGTSG